MRVVADFLAFQAFLGPGFLPGPLSRKSVTEISLVDKNMPAYTLFVQTNRRATVNGSVECRPRGASGFYGFYEFWGLWGGVVYRIGLGEICMGTAPVAAVVSWALLAGFLC